MSKISKEETIVKVEKLIETGGGDLGRLYHILEFLKNNRELYRSDQKYLESKLNSHVSLNEEISESNNNNSLLSQIQTLLETGNGDPGRLQHIYDMISNDRPLYHSDLVFLESKLQGNTTIADNLEIPETSSESKIETTEIRGSLPKGWKPTPEKENISDDSNVSISIKEEENKIQEQKKVVTQLNIQREKLSQLIKHRKEYEQRVSEEKSNLESEIVEERSKIESQTKLSQEIMAQKIELDKVKNERANIIQSIQLEKKQTEEELLSQKKQLAVAKLEQEQIKEQLQAEQESLAKMAEEQKAKLAEQAKLASEIQSKQDEFDNTKFPETI